MAPVGSRHASRHQATVMEKEERWERKSTEENEQRRGGDAKAETSGGDLCVVKESGVTGRGIQETE